MSRQNEIRQFKLTNGDEIVCEIVQWHNEEELELVVRKAMKLVQSESSGVKYYIFRPWMIYQENGDDMIIINGHHVVGIAFPTDPLLYQYREALIEMEKLHESRKEEYKNMNPDDIREVSKMVKRATDEIEEYLQSLEDDSDGGNVVDLFSKKTLH